MASGTLFVHVTTSVIALPVRDATVSVLEHTANGFHLVAIRTTDLSGNTDAITIATPERNDAQNPAAIPYTACDIWVEHPDYQIFHVENVEIYSGIQTMQEVLLSPLMHSQIQPHAPQSGEPATFTP